MKEIRSYKLTAFNNVTVTLREVKTLNAKTEFVEHSDVEQLQARIKELESAERTLINLGYSYKGGELWKPPVGKAPNFSLIDRLNKRIEDLDFERKKAFKARSDYFNKFKEAENQCNELTQKIMELESDKHINEIKAQGIEEVINLISADERFGFEGFAAIGKDTVTLELKQQVRKLRTNHN